MPHQGRVKEEGEDLVRNVMTRVSGGWSVSLPPLRAYTLFEGGQKQGLGSGFNTAKKLICR